MRILAGKFRLTVLELALVMTVIATLASLLFPMLSNAQPPGESALRRQCTSNIKQIALAVQMYCQDNGSKYPGIDKTSWVTKIDPYLGGNPEMFECPADPAADEGEMISYGLSGLLVRRNGFGVKEAQIFSPSEVGSVCDAAPARLYPDGGLIGGGGLQPIDTTNVNIDPRHDNGAIVGYCDGHAKYFRGNIDLHDEANGVVRALYHAAPLLLIDNPVAMLPAGSDITGLPGTISVGGEFVTRPLLMAAARMNHGGYYTPGFKGEYDTEGRAQEACVWGAACTGPDTVAPRAMAYDALCIIVAKRSRIRALPPLANQTYAVTPAVIKELFEIGYKPNAVQVYRMPDDLCSTNAYVKKVIGNDAWGEDAIEVATDAEMVMHVSNDPYGIGYCSSAFADPDRVTILAPIIDGKTYVWPRADAQLRWVIPAFAESDWPWKRSLDVEFTPDELGTGIAEALHTGALVKQGLYPGPYFTWGYWPGNY